MSRIPSPNHKASLSLVCVGCMGGAQVLAQLDFLAVRQWLWTLPLLFSLAAGH